MELNRNSNAPCGRIRLTRSPDTFALGTAEGDDVCTLDNGDLLRLSYDYGTTTNNGNVLSQTIKQGDFSTVQSYNYDTLNRLTTMLEQSSAVGNPTCATNSTVPCQQFGYDRWGNRWVSASVQVPVSVFEPTAATDFNTANRLTLNGGTFDSSGNLKAIGGFGWDYDAEGRLTSSTFTVNGTTSTQTFTYDGEGRRVKKGSTVYVYDAQGRLAAEYGGASSGTEVQYLTADPLGSTRLAVDGTTGLPVRRMDYLPFGTALNSGYGGRLSTYGFESSEDVASLAQRFTGKERDAETGLDYFGARYFSGAQGRFTSPDPLLNSGHPADPQTWNRYSYALNNPLRYTDPTGMYVWGACDGDEAKCKAEKQRFRDSIAKAQGCSCWA